jgi:hypothetical protein
MTDVHEDMVNAYLERVYEFVNGEEPEEEPQPTVRRQCDHYQRGNGKPME